MRFCDTCGARLCLAPGGRPRLADQIRARGAPVTERRVVTVLFADLEGFTALSGRLAPQEVRWLLTRYFDTCRPLIVHYGGVVEKYVGDAVMAVWGASPASSAVEDPGPIEHAEHAVRAALALPGAVTILSQEIGTFRLNLRVGVLTGEAAVAIEPGNQNLVAGDVVNIASRIQGVAPPGSVYVGDLTKHLTQDCIFYEDAGLHRLKGKAKPVRLWRALGVIRWPERRAV
jgi:class 3 adenylate cyclase